MNRFLYTFAQKLDINQNDLGVPKGTLNNTNVQDILRLAFGVAGAAALIIVIIGGFKYVLSQGNPQETAKAKNTILYALIGLVICVTAYSIVTFVVTNI